MVRDGRQLHRHVSSSELSEMQTVSLHEVSETTTCSLQAEQVVWMDEGEEREEETLGEDSQFRVQLLIATRRDRAPTMLG